MEELTNACLLFNSTTQQLNNSIIKNQVGSIDNWKMLLLRKVVGGLMFCAGIRLKQQNLR